MKVLYVNHTGLISGGERSLLELLAALPDDVDGVVACPGGPLSSAVRALGLPAVEVAGTDLSLRLGSQTPRGLVDVARAAGGVRAVARRIGADLVHANSIRAGLIAAISSGRRIPTIIHVRDCLPRTTAANLTRRLIRAQAAMILANSRYTAANFAAGASPSRIHTVYNSVDLGRFDPAAISRTDARRKLGLDESTPVLGVVSQITPWKGQDRAIRVLGLLRRRRPDARLLVVGSPKFSADASRYDNRAYADGLRRLVDDLQLGHAVEFLGERSDVPHVLRALDLVLVPSAEEPFGRTVIESMAMETPVIATSVGGPTEIISDGDDGVLLPPEELHRWADATAALLGEPDRRAEMARNARRKAVARFSRHAHVSAVLAVYRATLERHSRQRRRQRRRLLPPFAGRSLRKT